MDSQFLVKVVLLTKYAEVLNVENINLGYLNYYMLFESLKNLNFARKVCIVLKDRLFDLKITAFQQ